MMNERGHGQGERRQYGRSQTQAEHLAVGTDKLGDDIMSLRVPAGNENAHDSQPDK
jgi:hypothetical protein